MLLVTFLRPSIGIFGLLGVVLTNILARIGSLKKSEIYDGLYGLNALFLGMALGHNFHATWLFLLFFVIAIFMLVIATVLFKEWFGLFKVPYLVIPFLVTYWIISLSSLNFTYLGINHYNPGLFNERVLQEPWIFSSILNYIYAIQFPKIVITYFYTLSGILFQHSLLGGIAIAMGLLLSSRIAFSLSVLGFTFAFLFYSLFGANVNDFNNNLLGANYVFLAISIGCFYVIPNLFTYLNVIMFIPILMLILMTCGKVFAVFNVDVFTLPYCIVCIGFIFTLQYRWLKKYIYMVEYQHYSPEKNIYKFVNINKRFSNNYRQKISLPFIGEWLVTQGYDGTVTHIGEWNHALDFVVSNVDLKTYKYYGASADDFTCYNKPILAPLDGYVCNILNTVEDNIIGTINVDDNWGNTIVINHLNGLYSQICHIKKDSFQVCVGEHVKKGKVLAMCGNSGLSHEPHIHFQMQSSPEIGSKTISYPISYFIERKGGKQLLKIYDIPKEKSFVSNVVPTTLLFESYNFYPGRKLIFKNEETNKLSNWEVLIDRLNRNYIFCYETRSYAYFINDGTMFYFTDFEGDKKSLLYYFYLASYRQLLGCYEKISITDEIPIVQYNCKLFIWFQDFFVPFFLFIKAIYTSKFIYSDSVYAPRVIVSKSNVSVKIFKYIIRSINFEFEYRNNLIVRFAVIKKSKRNNFICIS